MKKIRRYSAIGEERTGIPLGECWFAKFNEIGDKLRIYGYECLFRPCTFEFETEYGKCMSTCNPAGVVSRGYFSVVIPLGKDYGDGINVLYCSNKRIIATLMKSYLDAEAGKHERAGVFDIVDEATADDIYAKNKIPEYPLLPSPYDDIAR